MEKRIIKSLIIGKQEEIPDISLIKRSLDLEPAASYIFIGLHRSGKSYLLYQYIQNLIQKGTIYKDHILYVNFDDERIASINTDNLNLFPECHNEMYGVRPWIFLEGIQNIAGWEKFVQRLVESKYRLFIIGNNTQILNKKTCTTLGSRFVVHEVFPFSFREYLSFYEIVLTRKWEHSDVGAQVVKLFQDYFYYGGFAESFICNDKRNWISSLYRKLLGDVILKNGIKNDNAIRLLVKKLAENVTQQTPLIKIKKMLDSVEICLPRNMLVDYIRLLENVYLIFGVSNFADKLCNQEICKKRYFWDNGLLNIFLFEPETKLLENLVAITLKKKYKDNLYFYGDKNVEVDFFIPQEHRAVQVSYSIARKTVRQNEVKALLNLAAMHTLDKIEIVTWDEDVNIKENGVTIRAVSIWKWLLKPDFN
jgi:predicted AAA+ superfamily ATPase